MTTQNMDDIYLKLKFNGLVKDFQSFSELQNELNRKNINFTPDELNYLRNNFSSIDFKTERKYEKMSMTKKIFIAIMIVVCIVLMIVISILIVKNISDPNAMGILIIVNIAIWSLPMLYCLFALFSKKFVGDNTPSQNTAELMAYIY